MNIYIVKSNKIETFILPITTNGSYWLFDTNKKGEKRSLVNITSNNNEWRINSNSNVKIFSNNQYVNEEVLTVDSYHYLIISETKETIFLYCSPIADEKYKTYSITGNSPITIGKFSNNVISYNSPLIRELEANITYENNLWTITSAQKNTYIYVNKIPTLKSVLYPGNIVFIMGLKIIAMGEFLVINNPGNLVKINNNILKLKVLEVIESNSTNVNEEKQLEIGEDEYFFRAPRFKTAVEPIKIKIDAPPSKPDPTKTSTLLTIGPMITMGLVSVVMAYTAIQNVVDGRSLTSSLPSLVMAFSMLSMTILWPTLNRSFQNKLEISKEKLRQEKYTNYINKKTTDIKTAIEQQRKILNDNNILIEECQNIILNNKPNLWERIIEHDDFLNVRLGTGSLKSEIEIEFPEEHFELYEDDLVQNARATIAKLSHIDNAPISISLTEKFITGIVGNNYNMAKNFVELLILQIVSLHSYEDVKIVLLTTENNADKWEHLKILPHCWNNFQSLRFFGTSYDERKEISSFLEMEFNSRIEAEVNPIEADDDNQNYKKYSPYYVIITDDLQTVRNTEIINKILNEKINYGFSVFIQNDKLSTLPSECLSFINIDRENCAIFENDLSSNNKTSFIPNTPNVNIKECYKVLANKSIKFEKNISPLPKTIGFLEMNQVGNIDQLNILEKWKKNNPSLSLGVPVGLDESLELFKLDLHEKFHGPHGLIAGMTGSGKSEFIITYILSLAINFGPDEVSFVIIDYKGGGLAGAFQNKETNVKLPHLVGTITNLDTNEMNRSLASIESELKRRQRLFYETREKLGESTIDIYKYQKLYREKKVDIPLSHLFIISDEFAELKTQQPEFMGNLMTIARIGRSLGVHLILATQKPAGVVNDQIWSNSKFRVCFRVQDRSDSMDMIKREDSAALKDVGRFYLQVGYNELFKQGQSAWCGMQYIESDKIKDTIDTTISFVDNIGYVYKNIDSEKKIEHRVTNGDELSNIVSYLSNMPKNLVYQSSPLWLENIPKYINIDDLKNKYFYQKENYNIVIPVGEYDIPDKQQQKLLTVPITELGNVAIYGIAGAGKEQFLKTLIYSAITSYDVKEVQFYVLDFGAETLKVFSKAPHVDNIVTIEEKEKIKNLFKLIKSTITTRKKLFIPYNGNYTDYCKTSGHGLPTIVVVINQFEAFTENYPEYEEIINQLTRDCYRYGVVFVLTMNTTSGLKYRAKQNFQNDFILQLNDIGDYSLLVSNPKKMQPSKIRGRGLVQKEDLYEFQIASISESDTEESNIIKNLNSVLSKKYKEAIVPIPILPDIVSLDIVAKDFKGLSSTPIGINTENLKTISLDFKNTKSTLILSQELANLNYFTPQLIKELNSIEYVSIIIIDSIKFFENLDISKATYFNNSFNKVLSSLNDYINNINMTLINNNHNEDSTKNFADIICIIPGIGSFTNKLQQEEQQLLTDLFDKSINSSKLNFIFIDQANNLSNIEYEPWFKKIIRLNEGIWVGNGLYDQTTFKLTNSPQSIRQQIKNTYGYYIKNGNPISIKLLSDVDLSDSEERTNE